MRVVLQTSDLAIEFEVFDSEEVLYSTCTVHVHVHVQ